MATRHLQGDAEASAPKRQKSDVSDDAVDTKKVTGKEEGKEAKEERERRKSVSVAKNKLLDALDKDVHQRMKEIQGANAKMAPKRTTDCYTEAAWTAEQIGRIGAAPTSSDSFWRLDVLFVQAEHDGLLNQLIKMVLDGIKAVETKHPEAKKVWIRWLEQAVRNDEPDDPSDNWYWEPNCQDLLGDGDEMEIAIAEELDDSYIFSPIKRSHGDEQKGKSADYFEFTRKNPGGEDSAVDAAPDFNTIARTVSFDIDELKSSIAKHYPEAFTVASSV